MKRASSKGLLLPATDIYITHRLSMYHKRNIDVDTQHIPQGSIQEQVKLADQNQTCITNVVNTVVMEILKK
jgi:hypothetical protein